MYGGSKGSHLDEPISAKFDTIAEIVGACQVTIERCGVELRQHVDLADSAVDAIAHGNINQAVGAANWHGWFCALLRERV